MSPWQTGDQVWAPAFVDSGDCFPVRIGAVASASEDSFFVRFDNPNSEGHLGKQFPQSTDGLWRTEREAADWCAAVAAPALVGVGAMKLDPETMRIARALPVSPETVEYVMVRTKRDAKLTELVVRTALETQQSVRDVLAAIDRLRAESGQA